MIVTSKKGLILILLCLMAFSTAGCNAINGNPTASEILKSNPNADIIKFNNLVYLNGSNVEWLQERGYSLGKELGEVKSQRNNCFFFLNGHATELPAGTKLYTVRDGDKAHDSFSSILMVEINGEEVPYLALLEG